MRLTEQSIAYSWRQLAQRVGLSFNDNFDTGFESLGISVHYDHPNQTNTEQFSIVVIPGSQTAWYNLLNLPPHSLDWLPIEKVIPTGSQLTLDEIIPVLFWGVSYEDGHKPFAEILNDKCIVFYADIIAATFFMLSRWEETVVDVRDEHDRFPATASVAYKQGFLDRPIVDEYALILGEWLKLLLPNWKPEKLHFTVRLSHDIDYIGRFSSTGHALRVLVGDVIKRRNIRQTRQTAADWWQQTVMPQHTLQMQGIYRLAQLSKENGLCSAFYFMTADHGPYDTGYDSTSSVVRQCIEDLLNQGHEVGFHPGYHTFDDLECLATEKARLDKLLGTTKYGGRQHVLRFQVPITWRHWAQVGLTYDSTLGFADYEGFRCGTCHPFQPFDLIENGQLKLWEIPLITMDTTLRFYRRLTPAEGETQILKLARHCKRVNGTFTLLWHNSSLNQDWYPWAVIYERTVRTLAKMQY